MNTRKQAVISMKQTYKNSSAAPNTAVSFVCNFLVFFSASMGILLSVLQALSLPWTFRPYAPCVLFFSFIFTILVTWKHRRIHRIIFCFFCVFCILAAFHFRDSLLEESLSFLGNVQHSLEENYGLTLLSSFSYNEEPYRIFLPTVLCIFLLLFYSTARFHRRSLVFLLLILPAGFVFLLNQSPTVPSLGFLAAAYLFWTLTDRETSMGLTSLIPAVIAVLLYVFCASVLAPELSPVFFQWRAPLCQKVNEIIKISDSPASDPVAVIVTGFSYETGETTQRLNNTAPAYQHQAMFRLTSDFHPKKTIFLRGFIGGSYSNAQWISAQNQDWESFLQHKKNTSKNAGLIYQMPYHIVSNARQNDIGTMSLTPLFPASYSYLPWGTEIPASLETGEDNRVEKAFSKKTKFSCFPLSLSDADLFQSPVCSSKESAMEKLYRAYVQNRFTAFKQPETAQLYKDVQKLPVFQSMSPNPSIEEIKQAAAEIQQFLWKHASYSLNLEPVASGNTLIEDFLYRQHKGFCVHFATAGTLLFRMYGIPARYVSGYAVAPQKPSSGPDGSYACEIMDSQAHAWTEIYVGKGGWIPVEMTPAASRISDETAPTPPESPADETTPGTSEPLEKEPETDPEEPLPSTGQNTPQEGSDQKQEDVSAPAGFSLFSVFRVIFSIVAGLAAICAALLLWRILCFRKRLGYFAISSYDCYETIFRSLLALWEKLYGLSCTELSDHALFQLFTENLPETEKNLFLTVYQQAESFAFGQEKPSKTQIRELRHHYSIYRKKLLKNSSSFHRFWYVFILGL